MKELVQRYWKQVLAALALALAGNLAYDLFKMGTVSLASLIWNASTLGIKAIQDSAYVEMAKGPRETAGMTVLYLLGFVSAAAAGGFAGSVLNIYRRAKDLRSDIKGERSTPKKEDVDELASGIEKRARRLSVGVIFVTLLFCFTSAIAVARASFVSDGVTWFTQCMRVLAPHLSEGEEERLWAQFAGMQSKEDFEVISAEMFDIARRLNTPLPRLRR